MARTWRATPIWASRSSSESRLPRRATDDPDLLKPGDVCGLIVVSAEDKVGGRVVLRVKDQGGYIHSSSTVMPSALAQRNLCVASVQEHYFKGPPQIDRGFKNHLYERSGPGPGGLFGTAPGGPAAFIAESLQGNAGGSELPPGYLQNVCSAVRGAGGAGGQ
jgi:hypothetical protein